MKFRIVLALAAIVVTSAAGCADDGRRFGHGAYGHDHDGGDGRGDRHDDQGPHGDDHNDHR